MTRYQWRLPIIVALMLALAAPVGAQATQVPGPGRVGVHQASDGERARPYIRNTNKRQVVCCVNFVSTFSAGFCPDNFQLYQTARLGVSKARGKWVKIRWIKLRSSGNHRNKLTEVELVGSDGGVHGYTLGPRYKRHAKKYKRIKAFPNPTSVKYKNGDQIMLKLSGDYAPRKNVPYACRIYSDTTKIFIHR
jgi:hypothetical protein